APSSAPAPAAPAPAAPAPAAPADVGTTSWQSVPGRGADVPFVEQEAEDAAHNGTVIGPDRTFGTVPSEASGRRAVRLDAAGEYVEFVLTEPANSIVVRYSVPDTAAGTGLTAAVDLLVNGSKTQDLWFTSRYAWYYGSYPFTNNPAAGNPRHFYDETRAMFAPQPAGARIRVRVASLAASPWFVVDLADFEQVAAPLPRPANSVSVTEHGADPSGAADSSNAFDAAVAAGRAQGRVVWVPQGRFLVTRHVILDQVTVRGAGPWYSVIGGNRVGLYGREWNDNGGSRNVQIHDLAIMGEVMERNDGDQVNAIGGALSDSLVSNVWMQHTKVGAWMDGPMDNLRFTRCRILDQTADALNFHRGVTNSVVEHTFVRNTGDDGLAMWAETTQNAGNVFRFNTVLVPVLANGIAIYGGRDITVSDNVVADTLTQGGGIHLANRFAAVPVAGTHTVARNTTIRAGVLDPNWQFGVGAIWFDSRDSAMTATIAVTDLDLIDSSYEAIHFIGNGPITGVSFDRVRIQGAGTFALQLQTGGSATFSNVVATGIGYPNPIYSCLGGGFTVNQGPGNSGWYTPTPYCGPWPPPATGPPPGSLRVSPSSLTFGPQPVGTTSGAQTLTVTNPGGTAVNGVATSVSGDFARTTTCGSSLAAGASCTVSVTFRPTAGGTRSGTAGVTAATGSPVTVPLSGTGVDPAGNLALGRPVTATTVNGPYVAGHAVDGAAASYWESANNAFPQSITVDLGSAVTVSRVVLRLPPSGWGARTQTLAVLGSTDGATYATLAGAAGHVFDPAAGNAVTITFAATARRFVRITVTGNTGWPAAQLSELEVYGGGGPGGPVIGLSPSALSFGAVTVGTTAPARVVTVSNTGSGPATLSGVTVTGDYARSTTCGSSLAAGASCTVSVTFTPTAAGTRSGTLTVAGSAPGAPHTASLTGDGVAPGANLALGRPVTVTSHADVYAGPNAVDGSTATYWESANNAFPQSITVDLGSAVTVSRVVLTLPPAAAWAARTQTLAVLGSTDGATYATLVGGAGYRFDPATGNTVTITFTATARRFLRLTFTGNTGWPAAQLSEFRVHA
ncbi:MAG TPA: discoidin domain-containing protein, partial [Pseudonocardiaceae bacterium]